MNTLTVHSRAARRPADAGRARITVLAVGGTGESWIDDPRTEVTGMLSHVVAELDDRFAGRWVGYPASYGPVPARDGISFAESVSIGVERLLTAMTEADGPVVLIGYSQGCTVVRRVLGAMDSVVGGPVLAHVLAVGLISDPERPHGTDPALCGSGVAGDGPSVPAGLPLQWISHPQDVICNASVDSFVRDIADATAYLALRDLATWAPRAAGEYLGHRFQNATRTAFGTRQWRRDVDRLRTAGREILGYLPRVRYRGRDYNLRGDRHTAYATEPLARLRHEDYELTGCQVLAQWLQVQATFALPAEPDRAARAPQSTAVAAAGLESEKYLQAG
ncbi:MULTISPECIES: PE-PPE domain-containing protein [Tsukamurella]|uniref:PE-PPE domain-containing protein n=2 Tax=Tsukamurella TaxID=2060 RepID=A0A5C5RXT5_9ACTN|nr:MULTISPECIES: PE-PPE domain-containing protein [Tsukamurella]NMD55597.1 PE-PPE domain-containing protein [Tsukamurella columbiensis]TWS27298.1 PE-PPE domain-containing protein [Tsukamurella conjunctivitidis]